MAKYGWGDAIGKIFNWIPGREESRRNKIVNIKREMDEILQKKLALRDVARYERLAAQLRKLEQEAANS